MKKAFLSLLSVAGLMMSSASATMTDNHGLHAVPVPGKITIDGKLDDWDLSGQVLMCYDIETLKDVYSAKVAVMYDADNVYVGIHWTTTTPMSNHHDPHYMSDRAWAADAVQLRIKTDKISHVQNWYYADRQEPAMLIDYGKDLKTPFHGGRKVLYRSEGWKLGEGAETAFRKDDDGKGYVQEIKLPWKLITDTKKYQAGDTFNMGFDLLWGAADWPVHRFADNLSEGTSGREFFFTNIQGWGQITLEPKGNLKLPPPAWEVAMQRQENQGPAEIKYTLPEDARVTLAIDDLNGKRVRNLVPALPRKKGKHTEHWDGLDDYGKPLPPGKYTFKALYHHGIHTAYQFSFANPGNPPWGTTDGRGAFYSDHTAPHAVAAAGDYVGLACPVGEAGSPIIACNLDGQRLWGGGRPLLTAARASLATDGKILWIALDRSGSIYRVDVATGKFAPWNRTGKDAEGHDFQVLDLPIYDASKLSTYGANLTGYSPNMRTVSLHEGTLAVTLTRDGIIKLLDKETGDAKGEIKIDEPAAAAFDPNGSLIVLSKGKLVRATLDGQVTPFAEGDFSEAFGIAVDSKRNVYLSVRGADQNVKVFSPEGKLVREIGQRGGRPLVGKFIEGGMREPAGIAVDSKDRLWVTEETQNPKRTSLWSIADGKFIRDFVGTSSYSGAGALNPFDPTMGFSDDTVYQLDWEKGTYRPTWSLGAKSDSADLFPPQVYGLTNRVIQHNGITYVFKNGAASTSQFVYCTMLKDGQWRSVAVIGVVPKKGARGLADLIESPLFAGHEGEVFNWSDKNGDGRVQADELTFARLSAEGKPLATQANYCGLLPDDEGTLTYINSPLQSLIKFPAHFAADGVLSYDINHPQILPVNGKLSGGEGMVMGGKDGRVYLNQTPLTAFDKDGKEIFTYPNPYLSVHGSHNAPAARPGMLVGPSSFYGVADMGGEVGEVFYLNGNLGENQIFTWDGLLIQTIFKDTRGSFEAWPDKAVRGISLDAITAGGESFGGNFVRLPNGKVYLNIGSTGAHIIELTGLNSIKRFSGKFTYTPEQYAQAQTLLEKTQAEKNAPKVATATKAATPVVIDGKAAKWPELLDDAQQLVEIQENPQTRYARVAVRYDENNLYLAYRVYGQGGRMHNVGQDFRFLFKTGDNVDLMLGPVTQSKDGTGNLRLLFSTLGNQPTAVLYEKTIPGTPDKAKVGFSSPWRTITFDRVTQPSDVKVATGPITGGYFVEASVPWSKLGVKPAAGLHLKADFGVLGADNAGTITVSRHYWSNKATNLVNDVPGEADLTPSLWSELILK